MNRTIYGINGPIVEVTGSRDFKMYEMVYVGNEQLIGEVIAVHPDAAIVQVYESTTGIKPGEPVNATGAQLSLTLGPGIIGNIFDGIERPLQSIEKQVGCFLSRGLQIEPLDTVKKWDVTPIVRKGEELSGGAVVALVPESSAIIHKIMIPPYLSGVVESVQPAGEYCINDTILTINDTKKGLTPITLTQQWPIRIPRPCAGRRAIHRPLITGQRVIDTLFPIAKGGTAAVPGGFGTGKTMTQHQLAKWSDADIIVYIGCGERGNEMTQVLEDFTHLKDPKTGNSLMDRTVLIANTSNMPVAAREASIYTGVTLAEYYRDMGYHVAIMADSTSRWAEALREISGRLEEMPAEEGFPAYLPSRLSSFYERAGYVDNLNGTEGSVSIIGAVSPQGGDFSEPVTQNTKRFVRCFWALDRTLAYSRHYPAIQWLTSYSEYLDELAPWYAENAGEDFMPMRNELLRLLNEESKLMEIVKLIGADVLPDEQKLILEIARVIRLGFLQQNAYHAADTYVDLEKQRLMMELILYLYEKCSALISRGIPISLMKSEGVFETAIGIKYDVGNDELEQFDVRKKEYDKFYKKLYDANA